MYRFSAAIRIAFGLACLSVSVVLAAKTLGLVPDRRTIVTRERSKLCELIAINLSEHAAVGRIRRIDSNLQRVVARHPDILSAALRRYDGQLVSVVGDHAAHWNESTDGRSSASQIYVPISSGDQTWGTVELRFRPLAESGLAGIWRNPLLQLALFVALASLVVQFCYLLKMLRHMDPSQVVPDRVRAALDTVASGVVVLDQEERIVLANSAFASKVDRAPSELLGTRVSELPWTAKQTPEKNEAGDAYPWAQSFEAGSEESGVTLGLQTDEADPCTFMVNTSPIIGEDGQSRGVLACFDDITPLEKKQTELAYMLQQVEESSAELQRRNEQLRLLSTQDSLTGCLNRRAFFEQFETCWSTAGRYGNPLSCIMIDVDHFKSVNDEHGHGVGDLVLQKVSEVLKSTARNCELICRYGGEEFCVVLPETDLDNAFQAAERFRRAIESAGVQSLSVTASLGVSATGLGAATPQILIDQADKSLYVAKRSGRNRVVRWDNVPDDVEVDESRISRGAAVAAANESIPVPYHAVTALISALAYRDQATAEHCRRVADYCVIAADGLLPAREIYTLEMGGLLHDIGKIGVPDSILLKPGPLTSDEWKIMHTHDRIGIEIIRSSFNSQELADIIENHHAFYGGTAHDPSLPTGEDIPLGARILSICDAYDAIVSNRVYRKGRSQKEAFAELRRCAGSQFDPELVERFIRVLTARQQVGHAQLPAVSKETALSIGLQIERLAAALDERDPCNLEVLAKRLNTTAARQGVHSIAEQAAHLEQKVAADDDLLEILGVANELLDMCRSTQNSYLSDCDGDNVSRPAYPTESEQVNDDFLEMEVICR